MQNRRHSRLLEIVYLWMLIIIELLTLRLVLNPYALRGQWNAVRHRQDQIARIA